MSETWLLTDEADYAVSEAYALELSEDVRPRVIQMAHDRGASVIEVMERVIKTIQPDADVHGIVTKLPDISAEAAIAQTDLVIGCFDNDYPRLLTTAVASKYQLPYIDAATDVQSEGGLI